MHNKKIRIAAMGDLHFTQNTKNVYKPILSDISNKADILLVCGDLTDTGHPDQARAMSEEFQSLNMPVLTILGNHDYESDKQEEIKKILNKSNIQVLDGNTFIFKDVGFAGVKGFMGGFDNHVLGSWGEKPIKQFVYEAVNETMKLEKALSTLDTKNKVVLLHYSPIHQTVEGEHPEIIPYCGSSRLVEPIDEFSVSLVFHAHAHRGHFKGKTAKGIPVYNVSLPLLQKMNPAKPYIIVDLPIK